jgi:hypothetical protein
MKIRIVTQDNYETFSVTQEMSDRVVANFLAGIPFTVVTDPIPGPWGVEYRQVHYNPAQIVSVEPLDLTPPT